MFIGINGCYALIRVGVTRTRRGADAVVYTRGVGAAERGGAVDAGFGRGAIVGILYRDGASQSVREDDAACRGVAVDIRGSDGISPGGTSGDLKRHGGPGAVVLIVIELQDYRIIPWRGTRRACCDLSPVAIVESPSHRAAIEGGVSIHLEAGRGAAGRAVRDLS